MAAPANRLRDNRRAARIIAEHLAVNKAVDWETVYELCHGIADGFDVEEAVRTLFLHGLLYQADDDLYRATPRWRRDDPEWFIEEMAGHPFCPIAMFVRSKMQPKGKNELLKEIIRDIARRAGMDVMVDELSPTDTYWP